MILSPGKGGEGSRMEGICIEWGMWSVENAGMRDLEEMGFPFFFLARPCPCPCLHRPSRICLDLCVVSMSGIP